VTERYQFLNDILAAEGLAESVTNRQQLEVFLKALALFSSRNEARGDLWAEFDLEDAGHNVRLKGQRIRALAGNPEYDKSEALDDGLDAINYSGFAVRHVLGLLPPEVARRAHKEGGFPSDGQRFCGVHAGMPAHHTFRHGSCIYCPTAAPHGEAPRESQAETYHHVTKQIMATRGAKTEGSSGKQQSTDPEDIKVGLNSPESPQFQRYTCAYCGGDHTSPNCGNPEAARTKSSVTCECGHSYNWHDTRVPGLSYTEVIRDEIRGRCSAISCPCTRFNGRLI
jgi:hypothetical protein